METLLTILTVLGARPQFIKVAMVSRTTLQQNKLQEVIVYTGQHFDTNMSTIFLKNWLSPNPSTILASQVDTTEG